MNKNVEITQIISLRITVRDKTDRDAADYHFDHREEEAANFAETVKSLVEADEVTVEEYQMLIKDDNI